MNFQSEIGTQRKCCSVDVKQDLIDEDDELFSIVAFSSDPIVDFESNRTTLTIIDDDGTYVIYTFIINYDTLLCKQAYLYVEIVVMYFA